MANENTLQVTVQVIEDPKNNVEQLVKNMKLTFDQKFKFQVSDEDAQKSLKNISTSLDNIKGKMESLGGSSTMKIDVQQYKGLLDTLEQVVQKLGEIQKAMANASWGRLGEDLNIAITEFNNLTKAAQTFGSEMSKSFMSSLVGDIPATIAQLTQLAKTLDAVKEASRKGDGEGGLVASDRSMAQAREKIAAIQNQIKEVDRKIRDFGAFNIDTSNLKEYKNELKKIQDELAKIRDSNGLHPEHNLTASEYLRSQNAAYGELQKQIQGAIKAGKDEIKHMADKEKAVERLNKMLADLERVQAKAKGIGVDQSKLQEIEAVIQKIQTLTNAKTIAPQQMADVTADYQKAKAAIDSETKSHLDNERAKKQQEQEASKLTATEQRLANAMQRTGEQGKLQAYILNDLKSMAQQYLSVWAAASFIENMAQITGELELQQKSLEVIIGSASTAAELFGEIRDLSQQSPYTFQDLLKSTRQLAAFGIETKDLYGTMKALSDIGAGLSVDVQRLILAYGHVRSYGYLSGIQNRQFETAGVDLIGGLVDRYNKLADAEERAGRAAERLTRKDVFKKMSKRDISFEDVESVIMDLAAPGGRFYNMQERQFDTLGGKLRNLRNNYNIMMDEMGKANHGALMTGVNLLNDLTANWQKYYSLVKAILVPLGLYKALTLAINSSLGVQSSAMAKNVVLMARQQQVLKAYQTGMSGNLFSAFAAGWSANGKYTPGRQDILSFRKVLKNGLANGTMTTGNLMYLGLQGDLDQAYRRQALLLAGVSRQQVLALESANALKRGWTRLSLTTTQLAASMRVLWSTLIANPMTWVLAIGAAIMGVIEHVQKLKDEAESLSNTTKENSANDKQELDRIIKSVPNGVNMSKSIGGTVNGFTLYRYKVDIDRETLANSSINIQDEIEELKKKLQALDPLYSGDIIDIDAATDQFEQLRMLYEKIASLNHANSYAQATPNTIAEANKNVGGWFSDSFIGDAGDYADELKDVYQRIDRMNEAQIDSLAKSWDINIEQLSRIMEMDEKEILKMYATKYDEMSREIICMTSSWWENFAVNSIKEGTTPWLGFELTGRYDIRQDKQEIEEAAKELSETFDSVLESEFKDDKGGGLAYLQLRLSELFSMAKISDPYTMAQITDMIVSQFNNESSKEMGREYMRKMLMARFDELFMAEINENTTREESEKIFERIAYQVIRYGRIIYPSFEKLGMDSIEAFREGQEAGLNRVKIDENFKQRLLGMQGGEVYEEFAKYWSPQVKKATGYYDLIEDLRKQHDSSVKEINAMFEPMRTKWGIEIDPDIKFNYANIAKLKKIRDAIKKMIEDYSYDITNAALQTEENILRQKIADEQFKPFEKALSGEIALLEGLHAEGIDFVDKTKDKKGGKGSQKDREAEKLKEIAQFYKKVYDWYNKYETQLGDKMAALQRTRGEFQGPLAMFNKEWQTNLSLDSIDKYREKLKDLVEEAQRLYDSGGHKNKEMAGAIRVLLDALNNANFEELEKAQERFTSAMKNNIDELTRKWEIFNNVLESTGNIFLAGDMSGISGASVSSTRADYIKDLIEKSLGGLSGVAPIDYMRVLQLGDKGIDEYVGSLFPTPRKEDYEKLDEYNLALTENHDKIKGIQEALKEWKKAQQDVTKNSITEMGKLIGSGLSYEEQVEKINTQLEKTKELNQKSGAGQGAIDRANAIAEAKAEEEKWKLTVEYANLMNRYIVMTSEELEGGIGKALDILEQKWRNNLISASDYAAEVEKLHKMQREVSLNNPLGAGNWMNGFAKGGVNGAIDILDNQIANKIAQLAEKKLYTTDKNGNYNGNDSQLNGLLKLRAGFEKLAGGLSKASFALQIFTGLLDGLQKSAQALATMFDALGDEDNANFWSDTADAIGAGASILTPLNNIVQNAMSGNISGIISSGISAIPEMIAGPVTALATLNDKQQERRIQELRKDVQQIDNTLNTIKSLRERTLGYDSGDLHRRMRDMYAINNGQSRWAGYMQQNPNYSPAGQAMYDYYNRASAGSGYAQELELLKKQREDYMKMYEAEEDKKKSSSEALEEYKTKIAELDEQIMYFKEDLAKELWSIDFQGWAGQLGDALMTAFENGTSAAEAFKDSVSDIMRQVVKSMAVKSILEPAFKNLQDKLFGENGLFDVNDITGTMPKVLRALGEEFSPGGPFQNSVTAYMEFLSGAEDLMEKYGLSMRNDDNRKNLTTSISSAASEETMGMVAGYLAALRQDTAAMRIIQTTFANEQWPSFMDMYTRNNQSLSAIDTNTQAIMRMMRDGEGAMYLAITGIQRRMDNFANGIDKVTVK